MVHVNELGEVARDEIFPLAEDPSLKHWKVPEAVVDRHFGEGYWQFTSGPQRGDYVPRRNLKERVRRREQEVRFHKNK